MRILHLSAVFAILAAATCPPSAARADEEPNPSPAPKPNIVLILIDDMGWTDAACYGSKYYETPQIDRLAAQGMRFTDAYAACAVCSPTRASIMTGKYPARLHLTDWIPGEGNNNPRNLLKIPPWRKYLPLEEVTVAESLAGTGYVSAAIGKWHLGGEPYFPEHQGFDLNVAGGHIGQPGSYFWPYESKTHTVPGLRENGREGEYLTDRLTEEAEKFIEQNRKRPFFLYLAHYAVHAPLQAKTGRINKYKKKPPHGGQKNPTYAAMVESVDQSVGRILAKLDALGIADRTAVFFTSDNGGAKHLGATSIEPLRAGKGYPYEGGVRVPLIVKWPAATPPGTTCREPVCSIDLFPTILEMAGIGADQQRDRDIDGKSLVPLLKQTGSIRRDALYWHYPHYWFGRHVRPYGTVRAGDWKLIEFYEDMRVELYNLKDDLGESDDLAGRMPEKAAELRERLRAWRKSVDAQMPTENAPGEKGGASNQNPTTRVFQLTEAIRCQTTETPCRVDRRSPLPAPA